MSDPIRLAGEPSPRRTPLQRLEADLAASLIEAGCITAAHLEEANALGGGLRLSTRLWLLGLVTEEELRTGFASHLQIPCARFEAILEGAHEHARSLSRTDADKDRLVPVAVRPGKVMVATAEPWRLALFEDLGERMGQQVIPCFLDEAPMARLLEAVYDIPADPRFHTEPEVRTRAVVKAPNEEPVDGGESSGELMSESQFDKLYQR